MLLLKSTRTAIETGRAFTRTYFVVFYLRCELLRLQLSLLNILHVSLKVISGVHHCLVLQLLLPYCSTGLYLVALFRRQRLASE